eukprot:CAMPEP_0171113344 /NCGR_PEP_ID=MMETSP0766_2-20121228/82047_1 /TAXON_ID=439317 /ORGANISM="Gambierdiscus australes, Strain CAWD 149" /LENGTH=86 /DNA_ID=CAMNT_0011575541 /DNA_START=112 /DNA_END=368 /DNA_ORIENTATION=-
MTSQASSTELPAGVCRQRARADQVAPANLAQHNDHPNVTFAAIALLRNSSGTSRKMARLQVTRDSKRILVIGIPPAAQAAGSVHVL